MFYEQFDKICRDKNTTPTALVKKIGYSTSKITAWKNGSIPKQEILSTLAESLNVNVSDFFKSDITNDTTNEKENVIMNEKMWESLKDFFMEVSKLVNTNFNKAYNEGMNQTQFKSTVEDYLLELKNSGLLDNSDVDAGTFDRWLDLNFSWKIPTSEQIERIGMNASRISKKRIYTQFANICRHYLSDAESEISAIKDAGNQ